MQPTRTKRVAIVGTAGRKDDAEKMNAAIFNAMVAKALSLITQDLCLQLSDVMLISGGAAWADHVAVQLYLDHLEELQGLHLYLPCKYTLTGTPKAEDTGSSNWRTNPGRTVNTLHDRFSCAMGRSTMADIVAAHACGAVVDDSSDGFHARNSKVAQADYLIAFTWGPDVKRPKDGGTLDTWNKCVGKKVHVPLSTLVSPPASKKRGRDHEFVHVEGSASGKKIARKNPDSIGKERSVSESLCTL